MYSRKNSSESKEIQNKFLKEQQKQLTQWFSTAVPTAVCGPQALFVRLPAVFQ